MDKIKAYGAHGVAYLVSALTMVAGLDPAVLAAVGGPKALAAAGLAGAIVTGIHNIAVAGAPKPGSVALKSFTGVLCAVMLGVAMLTMSACQTAPTAKQQSATVVGVNIAASFAIQKDDHDPAVWKARAVKYKAIALRLQTVNDAGNATLATLAGELQPLIAKLDPAEQNAANAFVAAMVPYLQDRANSSEAVAHTQEAVTDLLAAVVKACEAYGA